MRFFRLFSIVKQYLKLATAMCHWFQPGCNAAVGYVRRDQRERILQMYMPKKCRKQRTQHDNRKSQSFCIVCCGSFVSQLLTTWSWSSPAVTSFSPGVCHHMGRKSWFWLEQSHQLQLQHRWRGALNGRRIGCLGWFTTTGVSWKECEPLHVMVW